MTPRTLRVRVTLLLLLVTGGGVAAARAEVSPPRREISLRPGQSETILLGQVLASGTYSFLASTGSSGLEASDRIAIEALGTDGLITRKSLHAGDPDVALQY